MSRGFVLISLSRDTGRALVGPGSTRGRECLAGTLLWSVLRVFKSHHTLTSFPHAAPRHCPSPSAPRPACWPLVSSRVLDEALYGRSTPRPDRPFIRAGPGPGRGRPASLRSASPPLRPRHASQRFPL